MANLKDLIVNGVARVIGKVYAPEFVGKLTGNADTATQVKTVADSTNAVRYLTFVDSSNSSATAETLYTDGDLKYNPSTNTLTATTFSGTATTATKLGTTNVGGTTTPIYLSAGVPTALSYTIGKSVPANAAFTDTTYTVASGDSNGQIKITPSSGSAYNVSVKGLGSRAYDSTSYLPLSGGTVTGATSFTDSTASSGTATGAVTISGGLGVAGDIYAGAVHNAVWNDLADCIPVDDKCKVEPGYCYCFDGKKYYKSTKYLDEGIVGIDSDTYGMNMGHKLNLNQMDIAVAGFVLAYVDKEYKPGTPLTCTENGYLTEIKKEDKIEYPERIVATYWKSESAEEWGSESRKVRVNGRKWVKVV